MAFLAEGPHMCMHAKSLQLCLNLCNPMNCNPPGSSVHGISQARILEWFAISFSRGASRSRDWTLISCVGRKILYCWAIGEAPRRGGGGGNTFLDGKSFISWRKRQCLHAILKKIKQQTSKKFEANDLPLRIRLLLVLALLPFGDKWWIIVRVMVLTSLEGAGKALEFRPQVVFWTTWHSSRAVFKHIRRNLGLRVTVLDSIGQFSGKVWIPRT